MQLICNEQNIETSIRQVLRGSERKKRSTGKYILRHKDKIIQKTINVIKDGSFRIRHYNKAVVKDGGKIRNIQIINLTDRIVVNAIMRILEEFLTKRMIYTTASSIKKRGCCYLKDIIERDIRKDEVGTKYVYKIDIKKYYENIDHDMMKKCIQHYIKEPILLPILYNFVDMLPNGLSIGLRSSQVFGNLYLNWIIDHFFKDRLKVKYYYRYCDDIVVLSSSKQYLWKIHNILSEKLKPTGLSIKENYRIFPRRLGIDYLGYVMYDGRYSRLRKRIKKNAAKKLSKVFSQKRRNEIINSLKGYCLHSSGKHLFLKLVNTFKHENTTRIF